MATPWDQFIDAIEKRKTQLDDLLVAYADFRRKLDALPPEIAQEAQRILATAEAAKLQEDAVKKTDLIGKAALECARIILTELNNEPTHFSVIAKMAMSRGYKGRSEGSEAEVESRVQNSFWAALHRSEDFESAGKGCYRLATTSTTNGRGRQGSIFGDDATPQSQGAEQMTQKDVARRILDERGGPAKYIDIVREGVRRGWLTVTSTERNLSNSMYGMLTRATDTFAKVGPGEFDLVNRGK